MTQAFYSLCVARRFGGRLCLLAALLTIAGGCQRVGGPHPEPPIILDPGNANGGQGGDAGVPTGAGGTGGAGGSGWGNGDQDGDLDAGAEPCLDTDGGGDAGCEDTNLEDAAQGGDETH